MSSAPFQLPDFTAIGSTFTASLVQMFLNVDCTSWSSGTKTSEATSATTAISSGIPSADHRIVNMDVVPDKAAPQRRTLLSFIVLPRLSINVDTDLAVALQFRAAMQATNGAVRINEPLSLAGAPPVQVNVTAVLVKVCDTGVYVIVQHPTDPCPSSTSDLRAPARPAQVDTAAVVVVAVLAVIALAMLSFALGQLYKQRCRRRQPVVGSGTQMSVIASTFRTQYEPTISPAPQPETRRSNKLRPGQERRALHAKAMVQSKPSHEPDYDWTITLKGNTASAAHPAV